MSYNSTLIPKNLEDSLHIIGPQVKELGLHQNQAALYCLTFADGHQIWRIAKPVRHYSEIPTTLWPEFANEHDARQTFSRLVGWTTHG